MTPAVLFQNAALPEGLDIVPAWKSVFTSMFLHGGWMHLIGNMIYLWIFGNYIEDVMGRGRFLLFCLPCGFAAAMAQVLPDMSSQIPMIGASGAIAGVLGAYLLLFPRTTVIVWFTLGFIMLTQRPPVALVLGFYSPNTPLLPLRPINATNWNGCAATSPARRSQRNACP